MTSAARCAPPGDSSAPCHGHVDSRVSTNEKGGAVFHERFARKGYDDGRPTQADSEEATLGVN